MISQEEKILGLVEEVRDKNGDINLLYFTDRRMIIEHIITGLLQGIGCLFAVLWLIIWVTIVIIMLRTPLQSIYLTQGSLIGGAVIGVIVGGGAVGGLALLGGIITILGRNKIRKIMKEKRTAEQILFSNKKNCSIEYDQVRKVILEKKTSKRKTNKLEIQWGDRKRELIFKEEYFDHVLSSLTKLIQDKLEAQ